MKKILFIFLVGVVLAIAGTPTRQTLITYSEALGAGSSDTTAVSNVTFDGDSTGILLEINQDSISGKIVYEYTSPNGYTDGTAFASLPTLVTFSNNEKGVFSSVLPMKAGADRVRLYIISTNNKASIQTINYYVYSIKWR